jgi:hypothetical protein
MIVVEFDYTTIFARGDAEMLAKESGEMRWG